MGLIRFFSTDGRVNLLRFALVVGLSLAVLRLTIVAFWEGDTLAYVGTGALWGAVLAKLVAEAGRRLHDTGLSGRAGWWPAVTLPLFLTVGLEGPDWVRWLSGAAAMSAAVMLVSRGDVGPNKWGERPRWLAVSVGPQRTSPIRAAGWAAISVVGCALIALALISISHGMAESNRRTREWLAAHPPESEVDPFANRADNAGLRP